MRPFDTVDPMQLAIDANGVPPTNGWVQNPEAAEIVIVFVHGFLSNAEDCWTAKSGNSWPNLVKADLKFKDCAVFVSEYHTVANSGEYDVEQCTNELFNRFSFEPSSKYRPILKFENILFVCHSLGGILVRRLIDQQKHLFLEKTVGLFLVASPSGGSEYARAFDVVNKLYKNKIARQLNTGSEILVDLDSRFRNLIHKKTIPRLVGAEICEHYGPVWHEWLPIRTRPIVEKSSSSRYFGSSNIIPGTNHFTIAKPGTAESQTFVSFLRFFDQDFTPLVPARKIASTLGAAAPSRQYPNAGHDANALFDIYKVECEPYYLRRSVDIAISEALRYSSVWLCGPSGCGKTSIARHSILSPEHPIAPQIDLGLAYASGKIEDCYDAIISTYRSRGLTNLERPIYTVADVVGVLAHAHSSLSAVRILLDEIPLRDGESQKLTEFILNLITGVNSASKATVRFIICSISSPSNKLVTDKVKESLLVHQLEMWSTSECMQLIKLIESSIGILLRNDANRERLVGIEHCSPRKIKNFFRRLISLGGDSPENIERALSEFEFYGHGNE